MIVMDKSIHEEHLSQSLQTSIKKSKLAVKFPTGYKGVFNITTEEKNSILQYHSMLLTSIFFLFHRKPTNSRA